MSVLFSYAMRFGIVFQRVNVKSTVKLNIARFDVFSKIDIFDHPE